MRIYSTVILALLAACGGESGHETAQLDANESVAVNSTQSPARPPAFQLSPCEMLTTAMIREYLQPGELEITQEAGETNQSVYCQYKWYLEPTEEEKQAMVDARMAWSTARWEARNKGEPEPPPPTFTNRDSSVFFNVMNSFDNEQVAGRMFDTMVERLSKGMTIKTESMGDIVTSGGEMIEVDGLGDRAVWDPDDSQISVLSGTRLFHLKIKVAGRDDMRTDAERIAMDMIGHF